MRLTIISGILALLLSLFTFTACNNGDTGGADEKENSQNVTTAAGGAEITTEPATEPVTDTATDAENVTTAADVATDNEWKNAYKALLESFPDYSYPAVKFSVDEVFQGNGNIPELLVSTSDVGVAGVQIHSYINGEVKYLGEYGQYGACEYNIDDGLICSYHNNMGYSAYNIYRQTATGFEEMVAFTKDLGETEIIYTKNGAPISENQFYELLDEFYDITFDADAEPHEYPTEDEERYDDMYENEMKNLQGLYEINADYVQAYLMSYK